MVDGGKRNVLGIRVDAVDYETAVAKVVTAAKRQEPLAVSALAVHGVMTGALDKTHRHRLNKFDLLVPDGQPIRWALNALHKAELSDRVYGPQLMLDVCHQAAEEGLPIFLFGGHDDMLRDLRQKLCQRFPKLTIAGSRSSRFRCINPAERDELVQEICDSGARIVFVGLGCPRQEVFVYEMRNAISVPLLALGAAFSFHAGYLPQAPPVLQKYGLEWAFRLFREPRRLWRRYLLLNPLYLSMLTIQALGVGSFNPENTQPPLQDIGYG